MPNLTTNSQAWFKGLLDGLRVVVIAAVSAALTAAIAFVTGAHLDPTVQLLLVTFLTAIGKAWDKKIHEDPTTSSTGLLPF